MIRAARYLGVPPWELDPTLEPSRGHPVWVLWAILSETSEAPKRVLAKLVSWE